jgi:alkylated DNA repair dioxygenase AlkB
MEGITHIQSFIDNPGALFEMLTTSIVWDATMASRKTASYGKAYNYSQIEYPFQDFLPELEQIIERLQTVIGFKPNNCLLNYYSDGKSKMGYHSDQTSILEQNTGIAIVSLGATRNLKFRNIEHPQHFLTYELNDGSLIYMTQEIQDSWQHAIPKSETEKGRISLTFRSLV